MAGYIGAALVGAVLTVLFFFLVVAPFFTCETCKVMLNRDESKECKGCLRSKNSTKST